MRGRENFENYIRSSALNTQTIRLRSTIQNVEPTTMPCSLTVNWFATVTFVLPFIWLNSIGHRNNIIHAYSHLSDLQQIKERREVNLLHMSQSIVKLVYTCTKNHKKLKSREVINKSDQDCNKLTFVLQNILTTK